VLAGRPKHGKSWLALDLALGVGTGGAVLGDVACTNGPVLYLALEDSPYRMRARVEALLHDATPPGRPRDPRCAVVRVLVLRSRIERPLGCRERMRRFGRALGAQKLDAGGSPYLLSSHVPHCVRRVWSVRTTLSGETRRWRGSSIATVEARNVTSHSIPCWFGSITWRIVRIGSRTSRRIGPIAVDRSSGMIPDAKTECSTPSRTRLKAASITPRTG
jgi:hypothetical protein